jgi:hypothetical protein
MFKSELRNVIGDANKLNPAVNHPMKSNQEELENKVSIGYSIEKRYYYYYKCFHIHYHS